MKNSGNNKIVFKCSICPLKFEQEVRLHSHMLFTHGKFMQTCNIRLNEGGQRIDNLRQSWYELNRRINVNDLRLRSYRKSWYMIPSWNVKKAHYIEQRLQSGNRKQIYKRDLTQDTKEGGNCSVYLCVYIIHHVLTLYEISIISPAGNCYAICLCRRSNSRCSI
jgi:hypothetical protein